MQNTAHRYMQLNGQTIKSNIVESTGAYEAISAVASRGHVRSNTIQYGPVRYWTILDEEHLQTVNGGCGDTSSTMWQILNEHKSSNCCCHHKHLVLSHSACRYRVSPVGLAHTGRASRRQLLHWRYRSPWPAWSTYSHVISQLPVASGLSCGHTSLAASLAPPPPLLCQHQHQSEAARPDIRPAPSPRSRARSRRRE